MLSVALVTGLFGTTKSNQSLKVCPSKPVKTLLMPPLKPTVFAVPSSLIQPWFEALITVAFAAAERPSTAQKAAAPMILESCMLVPHRSWASYGQTCGSKTGFSSGASADLYLAECEG